MGYERKSLQILGGGVNLLPPGDKVPITDLLLGQNWRPDRPGKLESRPGWVSKFSIAGADPAHTAAVYGGVEGDYYVGAGTKLYYNFDVTEIASGFDGHRVGMVPMNGFMHAMNRSKQGKHNAIEGWVDWLPDAPATACSASTSGSTTTATSAVFTYALQSDENFVHTLVVDEVTYQAREGDYATLEDLVTALAAIAASDTKVNVAVTDGPGGELTLTPLIASVVITVSGTGQTLTYLLSGSAPTTGPNGTYQYWVTFEVQDGSEETNPGPPSAAVAAANEDVYLSSIPTSGDARVTRRLIYASGGSLPAAYLVGIIDNNTDTTFVVTMTDLEAVNNGVEMPIDHDPPPAAAGLGGPYFERMVAWYSDLYPNRVWFTEPNQPQYWPGASDTAVGNWLPVGDDGEAIIWATFHRNVAVFYKERSVWRLVGDFVGGRLEKLKDGVGLVGDQAVVNAGEQDYFVGPKGIYVNNLDSIKAVTGGLQPLFDEDFQNTAATVRPGNIEPGADWLLNSIYCYAVALGYAMGRLYLSYEENASPTSNVLWIYDESTERWMYHRSALSVGSIRGFVFDGIQMVGLTGSVGAAKGYNVDDFTAGYVQDDPNTPIVCVYQSHFENCGLLDAQKNFLEIAVDAEIEAGDTLTVKVAYDGAATFSNAGTITDSGRNVKTFPLGIDGHEAYSISVLVTVAAVHKVIIHNVHLYYYEEARWATAASTIPLDFGSPRVKQAKELELDINASLPADGVGINLYTDMPGNELIIRDALTLAQNAGRAVKKIPLTVREGFLWRLALETKTTGSPFRLYAARLLMRPIGTMVEAYEAAAGFVWDSQEIVPGGAAGTVARARTLSLEIETFGQSVTVDLLTDLPGNAQSSRFTDTVNTASAGRRFVRFHLPEGIEGRIYRLKISGTKKFVLYGASIELLPIGVYVEEYEAADGAIWDSREVDLGTPTVKQFREIEVDIEAYGACTVAVYTELPGHEMAQRTTKTVDATTGRTTVHVPLPQGQVPDNYLFGRLVRVTVASASAFVLYGVRIHARSLGLYIDTQEAAAGAVWDSTPLDLGRPEVKVYDEIRFEMDSDGAVLAAPYTDLPGEAMNSRGPNLILTSGASGRHWATAPFLADTEGRSLRVILSSTMGFRLYRAQVRARVIGRYLSGTAPGGTDAFNTLEFDFQSERLKIHRKLQVDMKADGVVNVEVLSDRSGRVQIEYSTQVTTPNGRESVPITLPPGIRGRLLRVRLWSTSPARVFGLRTWTRPLNEPTSAWAWVDYPLEPSTVLPEWVDLPIPPTPPTFDWAALPVIETPAQWGWTPVLSVEQTPDKWEWVSVPVEVRG